MLPVSYLNMKGWVRRLYRSAAAAVYFGGGTKEAQLPRWWEGMRTALYSWATALNYRSATLVLFFKFSSVYTFVESLQHAAQPCQQLIFEWFYTHCTTPWKVSRGHTARLKNKVGTLTFSGSIGPGKRVYQRSRPRWVSGALLRRYIVVGGPAALPLYKTFLRKMW